MKVLSNIVGYLLVGIMAAVVLSGVYFLVVIGLDLVTKPNIETVDNVIVTRKETWTSSNFYRVEPMPLTYTEVGHWSLFFEIDGKEVESHVTEDCYNKVSVGDKISVEVREGRNYTDYVTICQP